MYGQAEHMIQLLRAINHDYLNHFQVISGYLQMGRAQQALLYIKETVAAMQQRSSLFRLTYPTIALLLLQWQLKFHEKGRILGIECETDLKEINMGDQELQQLLSSILRLVHAGKTGAGTETWVLRMWDDLAGYRFEIISQDAAWPGEDWAEVERQAQALGYEVEILQDGPLHTIRCSVPKKSSWLVAE